ncbi:hypothetical protein [Streptococcus thermophilus]|jgi:ElaB/YqjD/DUF883 family membrane-anchored ribosome-binding protein|uniref:Uncharacterized protein n=1 Tax=Streptococcus thermophilus TaxID=1308 RepID=Q6W4X2_STRTR|nr:hypothetical protein [Streptococcus thermophilus]AAQ84068.1 unknown [Streptococcus thermophilus]ABJ67106.1 Predicted protein [Streptococcus thermophilus LMD-9]MBW7805477.1 hypothetical protein [Streptococcus thermophilus]MCE2162351.1 hypothetical protein [Streptococcus thermophilus]MCE2321009.1 hypothetical protein [Streptococcus thermophilus]
MVNWTQLFNRNERQDSSKDEWAEYTEKSLQDFMKSEFMQSFAEDCSQMLKDEGNEFYESYDTIKAKMNSVLTDFGYMSLEVYEDAFSEEKQLEDLLKFKAEYLASK